MDGGLKEKKMNINIEIKGQQAHIVNQQSLISGTSNLEEIKFDFSSEWDGYTKTAVIYVDDYSISDSVKVLVEKDVVSAENYLIGFLGKNVSFTLEFLVTIQKVEELLQQLYVRK